jgi:hypothetical protein
MKIWIFGTFVLIATATVSHAAAEPIPAPPQYYVLDEPHILSPPTLSAVQTLLVEHEHATGQQILVAIFKSLKGEELKSRTSQVFQSWAIGSRGKGDGALIALYWDEHQAQIEVGYGLGEGALTDTRCQSILSSFLMPELQAGNPNRAISLTVYQALAAIDSPLITNGVADRILRGQGGFHGSWNETTSKPHLLAPLKYGWVSWLSLGLLLMGLVGNILTSADAHFTRSGWFRPRPWRRGEKSSKQSVEGELGSPTRKNEERGGARADW